MFGTLSEEWEVKAPASEAWKVLGTLQLAKITAEALPHLFTKIDVLQGDGTAGTILEIFFPREKVGFSSFKETFTVVDDEKRVKVSEVVEGGFLDLGFSLYRMRLEVIDKENECTCITRATIEYEVKEEAAANAALVSIEPLAAVMKTAAHYIIRNYDNNKDASEPPIEYQILLQ